MDNPAPSEQSEEPIEQVGLNTHVALDLIDADGHSERMAFDVVRKEYADLAGGLLGADTPLARAILGKYVGARIPYAQGDIRTIRIVAVGPLRQSPTVDTSSRRQEILDDARRKAQRTTAEMFASSYDSKWGGYELGEAEPDAEDEE